jgi:hypothetical protein
MALYPLLLQVGTADGTPINIDMESFDTSYTVAVQLLVDYSIAVPYGMPTRPDLTGSSVATLDGPRTIAAGTVTNLRPAEVVALIAAGAARKFPSTGWTSDSNAIRADSTVVTAGGP